MIENLSVVFEIIKKNVYLHSMYYEYKLDAKNVIID